MNDTDRELLSAFFDGEPVDAAALAAALENEAAIESLRGFARRHAEVASSGLAPRPGWVQATRAKLVDLDGGSWWARWVAVPAPALVAAAVTIAALGIWGWRSQTAPAPATERPPTVTRTIAFELGKDWK